MVEVISNLHYYNMILILAAGAISGVWGLVLFFMKKTINRPWGTGLYYLHYVYGAIVALAIPVAIAYATGGKNQRRDILIYSIAALILVAAAVRALTTA